MLTPCIAFDLDDTLYLERDYVRSGFEAVGKWAAATLGIQHFSESAWRLFEQGLRGSVFQAVLRNLRREPEPSLVGQMVEIYRNHQPVIALLPDAVACLQSLCGDAVLSIITDGPLLSQRAKCQSLGLVEFCKLIVFTDQWGTQFCKPHPRAFQFVEAEVGRGDFSFVYVGDNPSKDFGAPLSLGWDTVRVRRPGGLHFDKESHPGALPRVEISDLSMLPDVIRAGIRTCV
jgi:putative hydrolase of the HAD superfamily